MHVFVKKRRTAFDRTLFVLHKSTGLQSLSGMKSDKKGRNIPKDHINQKISGRDRLRLLLERQIEDQEQAAQAADRAQDQIGAHRARQLVGRLVHLREGRDAVAREDGAGRVALDIGRGGDLIEPVGRDLTHLSASDLEHLLDHLGRDVEIARGQLRPDAKTNQGVQGAEGLRVGVVSQQDDAGGLTVDDHINTALRALTRFHFLHGHAHAGHVRRRADQNGTVAEAIAHATVTTAHDLNARAIITVSLGGQTARLISKYRPSCPIISCTMSEVVCRQMNMSWGVIPFIIDEKTNTDDLFAAAVEAAESHRLVEDGDLVAITAGVPLGVAVNNN